jgi:hypothetical protein
MTRLTTKATPDRRKIHVADPQQVKCWTMSIGVSKADLLDRTPARICVRPSLSQSSGGLFVATWESMSGASLRLEAIYQFAAFP